MAARDINTTTDRSLWTSKNAEKLVEEKYLRPNMGTCIDCHDKVNKGEKPWKDAAYSVPPNPEEALAGKKENSNAEKTAATATGATSTEKSPEAVKAEQDQKTQDIILQAIDQQQSNVKISMNCTTCHREIKVPGSHKTTDWGQNHGGTAIQKLDTCVNCHQDSKWIREIPKEDIMSILKMNLQKSHYTADINVVKDQARTNKFCSTCHSKRPPGHMDSNSWLTAHAQHAKTPESKSQCYVCHDKAKPVEGSTTVKAPTDVYCEYCHRTGVPGEPKS
jgi:cytochrome c-type protein NapC